MAKLLVKVTRPCGTAAPFATMRRPPPPATRRAMPRRFSGSWGLPATDGGAGRLIERPCQQTALRDLDLVQGAVGHRQIRGASVQRVDPRQPGMVAMGQLPQVDVIGLIEAVYRARQASFVVDARVSAADSIQ